MRIVVAPKAQIDLAEAYNSVTRNDSEAADRLLARVIEIIGLLATKAFVGREVVLRDGRRVRAWPIPPYRVFHQSRRPIER